MRPDRPAVKDRSALADAPEAGSRALGFGDVGQMLQRVECWSSAPLCVRITWKFLKIPVPGHLPNQGKWNPRGWPLLGSTERPGQGAGRGVAVTGRKEPRPLPGTAGAVGVRLASFGSYSSLSLSFLLKDLFQRQSVCNRGRG